MHVSTSALKPPGWLWEMFEEEVAEHWVEVVAHLTVLLQPLLGSAFENRLQKQVPNVNKNDLVNYKKL